MKLVIAAILVLPVPTQELVAQRPEQPQPIIDVHLHAFPVNRFGPPPVGICPGELTWSWDPRESFPQVMTRLLTAPPCANPLWSPRTDEELMTRTLEILRRRNIVAVTSGSLSLIARWRAAEPDRILPGLLFPSGVPLAPPPDTLRRWFQERRFVMFGEIGLQYAGRAPNDTLFEPYLALAEELDIPIGIHMGLSAPGAPYVRPQYRATLGRPLLLEDVLVRHPRLRVYVMHAGWPFLDEMLALLFSHPQVYVDVSVISLSVPQPEFYRYLRSIVEAGFGKRVMFGSDQGIFPEAIELAIVSIEKAPFLTAEQKRDILYGNAARFLRIDELREPPPR